MAKNKNENKTNDWKIKIKTIKIVWESEPNISFILPCIVDYNMICDMRVCFCIPWTAKINCMGSTIVVFFSGDFFPVLRWPLRFLLSPHRLEPPCMLGIFRTAMPSNEMLLRFRVIPSHYKKHGKELQGVFMNSIYI